MSAKDRNFQVRSWIIQVPIWDDKRPYLVFIQIHTISYIYRSSFPKQFTVGFSTQPRCARLGVGGCVLLPWAIVSLCLAGLVAASFALVFFFSFQLCGFWSFLTSLVRHFLNFCSGLGVGVHPLGIYLPFVLRSEWAWMRELGSYVFLAPIACLPVRLLACCYLPFSVFVTHQENHVPCCRVLFPVYACTC